MKSPDTSTWWERFDNDDLQSEQPWYRRREFLLALFVLAVGLILYLPRLGDYGLWSPWEPHYSQVAMEMNQVDTWLVPTYRHSERWFSKPILLFWFLKPSFQLFGQTEFAARLPIVLIAIFGLVMVNFLVGRLFTWKIGLLSAMILATSPQWFFISRQAVFDGPYVTFQTIALLFMLLGIFKYPDRARWIYGFWVFSALAMLTKGLLAIVIPASALGMYILVTWDWSVLRRLRMVRGTLIFLIIASPWFIFMTTKHGYPYFRSFFIHHHFERAAGLIKKPNATFDLYVQQIFYGTFPWSALLPLAVVRFLTRRKSGQEISRKNLLVFLCAVMPYLFFSFSSTKFNHYIFPVLPFIAIMVAVYLSRMIEEKEFPLIRLDLLLALLIAAVLAKDLLTDYKYLIHLFIYYYERALPPEVDPRPLFRAVLLPMAALVLYAAFRRRLTVPALGGILFLAAAFSLICNAWLMPRLADTFSQKKLLDAYERLSEGQGDPICEYHAWARRSVSYYFNNKSVYLNSRQANSTDRFFTRSGRLFCMVDKRVYTKLRSEVRTKHNKDLHIVYSEHPLTYLVSTEALADQQERAQPYLLDSRPDIPVPVEADFGPIRLLGYDLPTRHFRPGDTFTITLYFEALEDIHTDYTVFIHGEVPDARGRFIGDHAPAQGRYSTDQWRKGQIIMDRWSGLIPATTPRGQMALYVGFFKDNTRLPITQGKSDGKQRFPLGHVIIGE